MAEQNSLYNDSMGDMGMDQEMIMQMMKAQALRQQQDNNLSQDQMAYIGDMGAEEQKAAINNLSQDYVGQRDINQQAMDKGERDQIQRAKGTSGIGNQNAYVAASPLEHLADGIRGYQGKKSYDESLEAQKLLSDNYTDGNTTRFAAGMKGAASRNGGEYETKEEKYARLIREASSGGSA